MGGESRGLGSLGILVIFEIAFEVALLLGILYGILGGFSTLDIKIWFDHTKFLVIWSYLTKFPFLLVSVLSVSFPCFSNTPKNYD